MKNNKSETERLAFRLRWTFDIILGIFIAYGILSLLLVLTSF